MATDCPSLAGCKIINEVAIDWLDRVAPGHPPVQAIPLFALVERDTNGDRVHLTRSGSIYAVVLVLDDGTERATTVGCGPYECEQRDPVRVDPLPTQ